MKFGLVLLPVVSCLLCGCGLLGKTVGTAANAVGTAARAVTGPLRGATNLADEADEKAWAEKFAAEDRHDSRPSETKRAR